MKKQAVCCVFGVSWIDVDMRSSGVGLAATEEVDEQEGSSGVDISAIEAA